MQVQIKHVAPDRAVEFVVSDSTPAMPDWFKIEPDSTRAKIRTSPSHDEFRNELDSSAVNRELISVARHYLSGAIDREQAEQGLGRALKRWIHAAEAPEGDIGGNVLTGIDNPEGP